MAVCRFRLCDDDMCVTYENERRNKGATGPMWDMNGGGMPTPVRSVLLGFVPNRGDLFYFTLCTYVLMFYACIDLEILTASLWLNAIALNV